MGWGRWTGLVLLAAALSAASSAQQNPRDVVPPEVRAVFEARGIVGFRSIPSESMLPNLLVGDRFVVRKIEEPVRGDVVVFNHTRMDIVMVGRIVGLSGDRIEIKGGRLYLNGSLVRREKVRAVPYIPADMDRSITAVEYREHLPSADGDRTYLIHEFSDQDSLDETPAFIVPPGHLFMMGDNRDNSEDSRAPTGHRSMAVAFPQSWTYRSTTLPEDTSSDAIGFVPVENLIGRGAEIIYSLNSCKLSDASRAAGVECLPSTVGKNLTAKN